MIDSYNLKYVTTKMSCEPECFVLGNDASVSVERLNACLWLYMNLYDTISLCYNVFLNIVQSCHS